MYDYRNCICVQQIILSMFMEGISITSFTATQTPLIKHNKAPCKNRFANMRQCQGVQYVLSTNQSHYDPRIFNICVYADSETTNIYWITFQSRDVH